MVEGIKERTEYKIKNRMPDYQKKYERIFAYTDHVIEDRMGLKRKLTMQE